MKKKIIGIFKRLGLAGKIVILRNGALKEWNWFHTFDTGRSVDAKGRPIAWATYAFLHFIEPRLRSDMRIFEYGCGSSSLWYAPKVKQVTSVEHDPKWVEEISKKLPANAQVHLAKPDDYPSFLTQTGQVYDIVVVDGILRNECMEIAPKGLSPLGVIILDNSDRAEYKPGIDGLLAKGFRKIDFYGMFPVTPLAGTTTVFYRDGNCLGI